MKKFTVLVSLLCIFNLSEQGFAQKNLNLNDISKKTNDALNKVNGNKTLSNDDVIKGLKEALNVGTNNSVKKSGVPNGFYGNPKIKIPFPQDVIEMKTTLVNLGMKSMIDRFERTLNSAAEEAVKEATTIFIAAITKMTIADGMSILKGRDDEATQYLRRTTSAELSLKFKPVVQRATKKVELLKFWKPIADKYNKVSMVMGTRKVNPDLDTYVTDKAIQGLFILIAEEETKIRKDPAARISDILKKVFAK